MNKLLLAAVAAATTLTIAAPAAAQSVNERQWRQQHRIHGGLYNRELTAREYYGLQRQQSRINRYERRSRWDGGGLSARERNRLDRMQDRASRRIYRQKHDRQDYNRGWW